MLSAQDRATFIQASKRLSEGEEGHEQATTSPYLLVYPSFRVEFLKRAGDLVLHFYLPYKVLRDTAIPRWWHDDDGLFGQVLSTTALRFYGEERLRDLKAARVRFEQPHSLAPLDSWFFSASREEMFAFTTSVEERTTRFLQELDASLLQALRSAGEEWPPSAEEMARHAQRLQELIQVLERAGRRRDRNMPL